MSKRIRYTDGSIGDVKVVRDALPPPSDLVFREDEVKGTSSPTSMISALPQ